MYTFKPQAKSNAKRFLVTTCKVAVEDVGQYLAQDSEGRWGTYLDESGQPVRHQLVYAAKRAADGAAPAGMAKEEGQRFGEERTVPADALPSEAEAHAVAQAAGETAQADAAALEAALKQHDDDGEDVVNAQGNTAFGAFAFSQLTSTAAPAPAAPARNSTSVKIEKDRPTANGITRPSSGTTCARVWELAEELTAAMGRTAPLSVVVDTAKAQGINQFTTRTQYACWRKFNGIVGRVGK
jgi:hypothetical protein